MKENLNCVTYRTVEETEQLIKRLNVIGGQVNGVKQMLENNRSCPDLLMQISAIINSLKSMEREVLKGHLSHCVSSSLAKGEMEVVDDIVNLFDKFYK